MTGSHAVEVPRADAARLRLDVWTDLGCPWCYLGIHRIGGALDKLGVGESADLMPRSFELDPNASVKPMTITEIFTRKHGASPEAASQAETRMQQLAADEGLPFTTDRPHANSFDVHRVLQLANRHGRGAGFFETVQGRYFAGQINPYEHATLIAVAVETGLNGGLVRDVLTGDAYADNVRRDEDEGRRIGVTSVPFVLIDRRYPIVGAQSTEAYARAVAVALEEKR